MANYSFITSTLPTSELKNGTMVWNYSVLWSDMYQECTQPKQPTTIISKAGTPKNIYICSSYTHRRFAITVAKQMPQQLGAIEIPSWRKELQKK